MVQYVQHIANNGSIKHRKQPKTTENNRKLPKTLQQLYWKQPKNTENNQKQSKTTENNRKHYSNCIENIKKIQKTLQ